MTEITPPSCSEHFLCDPYHSGKLLCITLTEDRTDCLQFLELRNNCERAHMRVATKPLCVMIMVVDEVRDRSRNVGARVKDMLDSRALCYDGAGRAVQHEQVDIS